MKRRMQNHDVFRYFSFAGFLMSVALWGAVPTPWAAAQAGPPDPSLEGVVLISLDRARPRVGVAGRPVELTITVNGAFVTDGVIESVRCVVSDPETDTPIYDSGRTPSALPGASVESFVFSFVPATWGMFAVKISARLASPMGPVDADAVFGYEIIDAIGPEVTLVRLDPPHPRVREPFSVWFDLDDSLGGQSAIVGAFYQINGGEEQEAAPWDAAVREADGPWPPWKKRFQFRHVFNRAGTYSIALWGVDAAGSVGTVRELVVKVSDHLAPAVERFQVDATTGAPGQPFQVSFTLNDQEAGQSRIAGAWYRVGSEPAVRLRPVDGIHDSPTEAFRAILYFGTPGIYRVAFWGEDTAGNRSAERWVVFIVQDRNDQFVASASGALYLPFGAGSLARDRVVWFQGFEERDVLGWHDRRNRGAGRIRALRSGTNGIPAAAGRWYGLLEADRDGHGPFSFHDRNRIAWQGHWSAMIDIYLDPARWDFGEGFEYSVATNADQGRSAQEYVFRVRKDGEGSISITVGEEGPYSQPRIGADTEAHRAHQAGWHTFQHVFHEVDGALAVDMYVLDGGETPVVGATLRSPALTIGSIIGGSRHAWFPHIQVAEGVAVDNQMLVQAGMATFGLRLVAGGTDIASTSDNGFSFVADGIRFQSESIGAYTTYGGMIIVEGRGQINGQSGYHFNFSAEEGPHGRVRVTVWDHRGRIEGQVFDTGPWGRLVQGQVLQQTR